MSKTPQLISGIREIAPDYDGFILDLWGVLHDGTRPYPGVLDCLHELRAAGKRICLLSNAPRRVGAVIRRLRELGFPDDAYDHVMTSGEATHEALIDAPDAFHRDLGRRCLHIGPDRDDVHVDAGLDIVARPEDATFVLCTGIDDFSETVADYAEILEACARRKLPMVCANPDLVVVVGGTMAICAGTLAAHYETLGGRVAYHGKPYAPVYDRCLNLLGIGDRGRIVAVGDSFRTDIAGANSAGIDSVLVIGGIHAEELALPPHNTPDPQKIAAAALETGSNPTWVVPGFFW